jgi:hypothetical protein
MAATATGSTTPPHTETAAAHTRSAWGNRRSTWGKPRSASERARSTAGEGQIRRWTGAPASTYARLEGGREEGNDLVPGRECPAAAVLASARTSGGLLWRWPDGREVRGSRRGLVFSFHPLAVARHNRHEGATEDG